MSQKTFVMDARLPVSESTAQDDPSHPKNVCKGLLMVQNQALADTKYDIMPPPRLVEKFENPPSLPWKLVVSIFVVLLCLIVAIRSRSTPLKIVSIVILMIGIRYAIYMLEKRTV